MSYLVCLLSCLAARTLPINRQCFLAGVAAKEGGRADLLPTPVRGFARQQLPNENGVKPTLELSLETWAFGRGFGPVRP